MASWFSAFVRTSPRSLPTASTITFWKSVVTALRPDRLVAITVVASAEQQESITAQWEEHEIPVELRTLYSWRRWEPLRSCFSLCLQVRWPSQGQSWAETSCRPW